MSSTRKTPARSRAFTARSTLSVLVASATQPAKPALITAPAPAPVKVVPRPALANDDRHRMIAKVAYGYAERAGFGGDPVADWLLAEREIDSMLALKAS